MEPSEIRAHAYEESRYHRGFHHTLFGIYFALYLALLGYQLTNRDDVNCIAQNSWLVWPLPIILYAVLPALLTRIFLEYHDVISRLNLLIAESAGADPSNVNKDCYDQLTFQKYLEAFKKGEDPVRTGNGHWFFLINLWGLALFNFYVSWALVR